VNKIVECSLAVNSAIFAIRGFADSGSVEDWPTASTVGVVRRTKTVRRIALLFGSIMQEIVTLAWLATGTIVTLLQLT
jgi:hypothetical protein